MFTWLQGKRINIAVVLALALGLIYTKIHPVYAWTETDLPIPIFTLGGYTSNDILYNPYSLTVDAQQNIYVTDTGHNQVKKFDATGHLVLQFGEAGSGTGQFNFPWGISLDNAGNIYVGDRSNHRVQKFDSAGHYLMTIGTYGSGNGQLSNPYGVAVNADSTKVYVVNSSNARVEVFDTAGNYLSRFGSGGSGDGQFSGVRGIALDSSGNVYVADSGNRRIQKFDSNGNFILKFGSAGTGDGQFNWPAGITVDNNGFIYVPDTTNNNIQKFTNDGIFISKFGATGTGNGQFAYPSGIDVDNVGNIYINELSNGRIQKFDSNFNFILKFGTDLTADGRFSQASGVAMDSQRRIYALDLNGGRVEVFDTNGGFLGKFGTSGSGIGQLSSPGGIAIKPDGTIYIADTGNNRVEVFDSSWHYMSQFGSLGSANGQMNGPKCVAVDSEGFVYVSDTGNNRIEKFDADGNFVSTFGSLGSGDGQFNSPRGLKFDSSGNIYVVDQGNNRVQKFDRDYNYLTKFGTTGSGNGQLRAPYGITFDNRGNIYIADQSNQRIQKFDANGNYQLQFGGSGTALGKMTGPLDVYYDQVESALWLAEYQGYRVQKFVFDHNAPTITVNALENNATSLSTLTINSVISDELSDITAVSFQLDTTNGSWQPCTAADGVFDSETETVNCSLNGVSEGQHILYINATDSFTNTSTPQAYTFSADFSIPTGSMTINNGAMLTNNKMVLLSVTAADSVTSIAKMILSEDSEFNQAYWENYVTSKNFALKPGEGLHTVYAKVKDAGGNESEIFYATITVDTIAPKVTISDIGLISNVPDKTPLFYYFTSQTPHIKGITEAVCSVKFLYDNSVFSTVASSEGKYSIQLPELPRGLVTLTYYATDQAGNESPRRVLKLMIGEENFPVKENQGSTDRNGAVTPDTSVPVTPAVHTVTVVDEVGIPIADALLYVNDQPYKTNAKGLVYLETEPTAEMTYKVNYNNAIVQASLINNKVVANIHQQSVPTVFTKRVSYSWLWMLLILFAVTIVVIAKKSKTTRKYQKDQL